MKYAVICVFLAFLFSIAVVAPLAWSYHIYLSQGRYREIRIGTAERIFMMILVVPILHKMLWWIANEVIGLL